jgi:ABC-2 type transport system ATP-binding protein
MSDVAVVRVQDVSKRFVIRKEKSLKERVVNAGRSNLHKEDFWALRDVSLEINSGSTVGLIGANGSGKSTLLKLIGGIMQPTSGAVTRRGRLAALIELGAGFHPDLTGRENVYLNCAILGLSRSQTKAHFDSIVAFSGIEQFIDTQVKFYSSGMYVRLAFAVAVHVDPDVLLVDEVLAVGDEPFQRKCMDRIHGFQAEGRTIIIVTHALDQVAELCDRAVVLESGRLAVDGAPVDALRYLRADYEVTRAQDRARERGAEAAREAGAHVGAVTLAGRDGEPLTMLHPGDDLFLHIQVDAPQRLDDWVLGIGVDTALGQPVFGTNTKLMGVHLPPLTGTRQFTIRIPGLQLGEGSYSVHAALAEPSGAELDRLIDAAQFRVEADGTAIGFVYARAEFSTD